MIQDGTDSYDIDGLDGYDFEELIHHIFSRHGFDCQLMPRSRDGGIDVIAVKNEQELLIECKHWKNNAGRPIIQKLHSAILTYKSNGNQEKKGIVVCTGNFSPDAVDYAATLNGIIELWDYRRIRQFAYDVGIIVYSGRAGDTAYFGIPTHGDRDLKQEIMSGYISGLRSHPRNPVDVCSIGIAHQSLASAVSISYRLDKSFSTSIGEIHRAFCEGTEFIPLDDPGDLDSGALRYLARAKAVRIPFDTTLHKVHGKFLRLAKTQKEAQLREELARRHTKQISYYGRNNQRYNKVCEVKPQDIKVNIRDIVYYIVNINIIFGPRHYNLAVADDANQSPYIIKAIEFDHGAHDFLNRRASLCNDCGSITPFRRSYACAMCGRTLCPEHIWLVPGNLFHRTRLCHTCFRCAVVAGDDAARAIIKRSDVAVADTGGPSCFVGGILTRFGFLTLQAVIIVGALAGFGARLLGKAYHYGGPDTDASAAFSTLVLLGLLFYYTNWSKRSQEVRSLKERLLSYRPAWE